MLRIQFLSAIRSLVKNKNVSGINILGLTIGLTAFLIFITYLIYENSYDSFFNSPEQVYRVNLEIKQGSETTYHGAKTPRKLYFDLKEGWP